MYYIAPEDRQLGIPEKGLVVLNDFQIRPNLGAAARRRPPPLLLPFGPRPRDAAAELGAKLRGLLHISPAAGHKESREHGFTLVSPLREFYLAADVSASPPRLSASAGQWCRSSVARTREGPCAWDARRCGDAGEARRAAKS